MQPKRSRGELFTYTGMVSFPGGAPSLFDIAVSHGRECRYAGAGMRWYPVLLHTFVVSDLLPPALKLHGLMHDASESITGDVPSPVKTLEIEAMEHAITRAIYKAQGLRMPTPAEHRIIKRADRAALCGEVYTVGTQALQTIYPRSPLAEKLTMKYAAMYPPMECLEPSGLGPIEFMRRFRIYSDMLKPASRLKRR